MVCCGEENDSDKVAIGIYYIFAKSVVLDEEVVVIMTVVYFSLLNSQF